MTWSQARWQN